jgi:hypothetical protein
MTEEEQANAPSAGGQIFAYHITTDAVKMKEVRASVGQPVDPRMGEMYPSEWKAFLDAESAKDAASDQTSTQPKGDADTNKTTPIVSPADVNTSLATAPLVAAEEPDEPTNAEAVALAEDMTKAKVDRCEHNRVNECEKCGVERVRGILFGEDGEPLRDESGAIRWKIAWRAIQKAAP